MPTPSKGYTSVIYVAGYDLTRYLNELGLPLEVDQLDNTMFGNGGWEETTTGIASGEISLKGIHTGDANDARATLEAAFLQDNTVALIGPAGSTVGNPALLTVFVETKYEVKSGYADLVKITADASTQGGFDWGVFLHAKTEETGDGNGTTVDNGAATTNGWAAVLELLALTTSTVEAIIEHSANGSTWATLYTFGAQSDVDGYSASGSGTVNRYVRVRWAFGTGGTSTFTVGFARR